jgi:uncharacterized RDD family membrane protein YckC
MTLVRKASLALVAALAIGVSANLAAAQTRLRHVERQITTDAVPAVEIDQLEPRDFFRYEHRAILRIWQDYLLKSDDAVRGVVVIFGNATIEGRVEGDVVVVFGQLRLAKSAVVSSSVSVTAGDVVVEDGAAIRGDLVVVGGGVTAAPDFSPGGEHVIVGTSWLGDRLREIVPWFTRGLMWGRIIVPSLGWVWTILAIVFLIALLINQVMHGPVSACANTLSAKPFSTFLVGLLVMLLAGPLSVLLAATVVGIIVVPFLWCALFIGWMVGKVGVNRWLGRVVTGQSPPESHMEGLRSFLVGFVLIALLYMVPIVGLMTWALVGVFGLGAATQSFMAAIRRERPAPAPKPTMPSPPAPPTSTAPPPSDLPPSGPSTSPLPDAPAIAFTAVDPLAGERAAAFGSTATRASPPVTEPVSPMASAAGELVLMPHATFLDRLAALALDLLLVLLVRSLLVFREDETFFFLLFAYYTAFLAWKGTTIGGIVCNLRVIRADGQSLRFVDSLVRALSAIFSFIAFGLGFLWILRDPERQAWHDRIAGTYVVRVPRTWPLP